VSETRFKRSEPMQLGIARTWGPLAVVVSLIGCLLVWVGAADPLPETTPTTAQPHSGSSPTDGARVLPPGVEVFARAKQRGTADTIDWGDRCDTSTGKLKLPQWPQSDCFAPFAGPNGGSTETGVEAETIKVVLYQAKSDDPVLSFIYSQIGNRDTNDDIFETFRGFVDIYNRYYELYGRKVVLDRYIATGAINDAVAATADAETIARDIKPFAVIGGPDLTEAFADTLAANKVLCIACTPGQPGQWYVDRAPYVWSVLRTVDQGLYTLANYLGRRVAGRKAEFAGDASMRDRKRVLGLIRLNSSANAQELEDYFTGLLRDRYEVEFAEIQSYGLPTELAASGKDIITAMKEAGVTTVVFSGDPLGPQSLTKLATEQGYYPEWVLGVTSLVDTTVFSRTYDQSQWAHAFGPSGLFAPTPPGTAGPSYLYRWYFGEPAPAERTVSLISGPLQVLFGALQGIGPNVTHQLFQDVLFGNPIRPPSPITAQVSFGNHGVYPNPDFAATDDATEVWWDPTATGVLSEIGGSGVGAWQFANGAKRYLPDEWPEGPAEVFDRSHSITGFEEIPPAFKLPEFPPLR